MLITRTYHSADCDTDHSLVCSKVRLHPKRFHRSKQEGRPRIGTARVSLPGPRERFAETMEKALEDCPTDSATARWNYIRDAVYEAASDAFGMRDRKSEDWFEAGIKEMEPAITAKSTALLEHKKQPSKTAANRWRDGRSITRSCTLRKAIKSLASSKAPGSDGLPPEIVKLASESSLLGHLHDLLL